jgi:hypothetical protein
MNMEVSFVCSVNGLANAMRQVNIRRADADSARPFADIHDSVQRMLGFLSLLLIVDEIQDVGAVLDGIVSSQHDDTGRAAISHALAGRAEYLAASWRVRIPPLPPAIFKHRLADGTNCGLRQFELDPVRIVDVLAKYPVSRRWGIC